VRTGLAPGFGLYLLPRLPWPVERHECTAEALDDGPIDVRLEHARKHVEQSRRTRGDVEHDADAPLRRASRGESSAPLAHGSPWSTCESSCRAKLAPRASRS